LNHDYDVILVPFELSSFFLLSPFMIPFDSITLIMIIINIIMILQNPEFPF